MSLEGRLGVTVGRDAVEFAFTVRNAAAEPVGLEFRSGKTADVAVYEDGAEVWRWSDGRMFTQAVRTETLAPGESFTHEAAWESPRPGTFTAEASLESTATTLVERAAFEF